jgi:hypothetical protein
MDRLEDLDQTYLKNIADNQDYENLEFVLLNYNSKDKLDTWVLKHLSRYLDSGLVKYYKTEEPKYYSMTHSRNIVFKSATGDIITNVDADHFTNKGFASRLNLLANQGDKKAVFVKSHQKNRGRIGMFKDTFLSMGGYDEQLKDYGFDDKDILHRAYALGCKIIKYGGEFFALASNHSRHLSGNYLNQDWRYTQDRNALISLYNLSAGRYLANAGSEWGYCSDLRMIQ